MLATIVQARMGSSRLPGKVLMKVGEKTILERVLDRIGMCEADTGLVVVATGSHTRDDVIADFCLMQGVECYRSSEHDVLNRYYQAALHYEASLVLRVTADEPLLCPELTARILGEPVADYVTVEDVPLGLTGELITFEALHRCWRDGHDRAEREHVTLHALRFPGRFNLTQLRSPDWLFDRRHWRLTVDTEEDLLLLKTLYSATDGGVFGMSSREIVDVVEGNGACLVLAERAA